MMASSVAIVGIGFAGVTPMAYAEEGDSATVTNVPVSASNRLAGATRYETSKAVANATGLTALTVPDTSPDALVGSLLAANSGKSAIMSKDAPSLGGADRYESAANAALKGNKYAALVVANGTSTVDILTATSFAANKGGNLLLVKTDEVGKYAAAALDEMQPASVTIVGGTGVVSEATKKAIESATGKTVTRISGADRYRPRW